MKVKCPSCGKAEAIRIVYGFPVGDDIERSYAGELELGGCIVWADAPTHVCPGCGVRFGRLAEDEASLGGAAFVSFPEEPQ